MKQQPKNRRKSQEIFTWIRHRISPYCFGIKTQAGNPAYCNTNADVVDHFRRLRKGVWGGLCRLDNAAMADHCAGRKTYYFTSDGRSSATKEVLVNIDIDCHKSGTLAGAQDFAQHLRETRFPGLYYESSTNGRGVHGYLVVVKGDLGDEGLNPLLKRLDRDLKAELARGRWDVEDVEIKAHSPEFRWGRAKYELLTYKAGQLAKLPREALKRTDELRATTRVSVEELRRIKSPETTSVTKCHEGGSRLRMVDGVRPERTGSIEGKHFGQEELARLGSDYQSLARKILGEKKLEASGRKVVTAEDMAIFLMLLRFFTGHMNADGSLPTARWREMWRALYEAGDVVRPWCHRRYAAMRNFLSQKGLLAWDDEGYLIGETTNDGHFYPGRAARWHAGARLMEWMSEGAANPARDGDTHEEARKEEVPRVSLSLLDGAVKEVSILYGCSPSQDSDIHFKKVSIKHQLSLSREIKFGYPPLKSQFMGFIRDRRSLAA